MKKLREGKEKIQEMIFNSQMQNNVSGSLCQSFSSPEKTLPNKIANVGVFRDQS